MGFISKLFKGDPAKSEEERPAGDVASGDAAVAEAAPIPTPVVMPAYVPPDARPTPTDIHDRPTVLGLEQPVAEDRPTMVMPEATATALARSAGAGVPPRAPVPRPIARADSRPSAPKPPPLPRKPSPDRARIRELVEVLRRQNDAFEHAASGWTEDAIRRKKEALLARGETMRAIDLQLGQLGEAALVRELERLPFARKVTKLDAFLKDADTTRAPAPVAHRERPGR